MHHKNEEVWIRLDNPKLTNFGIADELNCRLDSNSKIELTTKGNCRGRQMPGGSIWNRENCRVVAYRHSDPYLVVFKRFPAIVKAAQSLGRRED